MLKVCFVNKDRTETTVNAEAGMSILDVAFQHDIDLEGACGGVPACGTCHVVVDPDFFDKLPEASSDEEDVLDMVFGLQRTSRLACQIIMQKELDGIRIIIP